MMSRCEDFIEKCIGCGLCKTVFSEQIEMDYDSNGFLKPFLSKPIDKNIFEKLCPLTTTESHYSKKIWGDFCNVYLGFSKDPLVREQGSSGGVLSQVLIYLIETKKVNAVIHVGASKINPLENQVFISRSREEILKNAGSRYSPASPLVNLHNYLSTGEVYAFVGKPCDIRAIRNYEKINKKVEKQIPYKISFFCAGTPSKFATEKIIRNLHVKLEDVKSFRYRGYGWPGFATVIDKKDNKYSMSYDESWGKILGRDIQPYCRWCADGTGEFADISCGDGWYLDECNKPNFSEANGRNVIFARTELGDQILANMKDSQEIQLTNFRESLDSLVYMQNYQYERKATILGKILALKFLGKNTPIYKIGIMLEWAKYYPLKKNIRVFFGTIKRSIQGKF